MDALLAVTSRWLHISSVVILLSAYFYSRFSGIPFQPSPRLRKWTVFAIVALIASGLYNLITKASIPPGYHMWFGIKMLLALHVIAVALVSTRPGVEEARRVRLGNGIAYSALLVLAISAWLRWISLLP